LDEPEQVPGGIEPLLRLHTPDELWQVRSAVWRNLADAPNARMLLALTGDYYRFSCQVQRAVSAADFTMLARTIELGRDAIGTLEQMIMEDNANPAKLLTMVIMAGSNYLADTAFIRASLENCEQLVDEHRLLLYDHCWELSRQFGRGAEAGDGLDGFFQQAYDESVPLAQRVALTFFLYRLLCIGYLGSIIQNDDVDLNWNDCIRKDQ